MLFCLRFSHPFLIEMGGLSSLPDAHFPKLYGP